MPFEDFRPVLREVKRHQPGIRAIVNTVGGEPLVRPDLIQCGREIVRSGFYWGMVSNAMLLDGEMMKELSRNGLCSLSIDIDGLPEEHNWLRHSENSFDRAYNAIVHIRKAPHLVWDVITCVNQRNFPHLDELKRMLIDAGVQRWRCFTIIPMGRAKDNPELLLTNGQLRKLMDFIVRTREEGIIGLSFSCEAYLGDYEHKVRNYPFFCHAGISTASVRANGDISACLSVRGKYAQGNIYRDSFWDVWTNRFEVFRKREWMKTGECANCDVFNKCHGNGMHLRNDDGSLINCLYHQLYPQEK